MRKFRITTTIVIGMTALSACKPKTAPLSQAKSLENFAAGEDVRINVCSAPFNELDAKDPRKKVTAFFDVKDAGVAQKATGELMLALSAVPDDAFRLFQMDKGKVLVSENAAKYCSFNGAVKFKGKSPVFQSCFVTIPYGSGKTKMEKALEGRTLVVSPDTAAIRHGIVRSFGYFVADFLARDPGFSTLKVELAKSFLADVAASKIFSLVTQEPLLGAGIDGIVRANLKAGKPNPLQGAKADAAAIAGFMNYVIGEAFDS